MSSRIRSEFGSLADRLGQSTAQPSTVAVARHVWVDATTPGLLVRWRSDPQHGWFGQVCVVSASTGEPVAEWVSADRLSPVDPQGSSPPRP